MLMGDLEAANAETRLTGITQETVDKADTFPEVWERYNEFLAEHEAFDNPNSFAFLTCGAWDLKTMLPTQLKHTASLAPASSPVSATPPYLFNRVINIKKAFSMHYNRKQDAGMAGMLRRLNLELEGRHHSGIDDCKNIARIVKRMQDDDWKAKF
ncbi:ERI1 exoribonuclease 3 [Tulasnella sp. JGI-2019a]|nr:ERI1 exoribonuclease 3 [Tulasnella sp. JGI-2019a]